jgi:hypothetical protein
LNRNQDNPKKAENGLLLKKFPAAGAGFSVEEPEASRAVVPD